QGREPLARRPCLVRVARGQRGHELWSLVGEAGVAAEGEQRRSDPWIAIVAIAERGLRASVDLAVVAARHLQQGFCRLCAVAPVLEMLGEQSEAPFPCRV